MTNSPITDKVWIGFVTFIRLEDETSVNLQLEPQPASSIFYLYIPTLTLQWLFEVDDSFKHRAVKLVKNDTKWTERITKISCTNQRTG